MTGVCDLPYGAQTMRWLRGVGICADQQSDGNAFDDDRFGEYACARPRFAARRRVKLAVPAENAVAAKHE